MRGRTPTAAEATETSNFANSWRVLPRRGHPEDYLVHGLRILRVLSSNDYLKFLQPRNGVNLLHQEGRVDEHAFHFNQVFVAHYRSHQPVAVPAAMGAFSMRDA